ncbi:MAG: pantothenate kinase [Candidatus Methanomethylophilaceae archaeon]|nr:pantothenate kinase [Candidatus Methanomethylophilaceae archaeon]
MIAEAFCPGHVTCIFAPIGQGSVGVGIKLSLGATVRLYESESTEVVIDGEVSPAPVTRAVLSELAPGKSYRVEVADGLPVGQGFGMSAAGALAVAYCVAHAEGLSEKEAQRAAYLAEVIGGGGLGDVPAILCDGRAPVRLTPGLDGDVEDGCQVPDEVSLVVLGSGKNTGATLRDPSVRDRITLFGRMALSRFLEEPSLESMVSEASAFSSGAGLRSAEVDRAIKALSMKGIPSGMCMLGNSVFAFAPADVVSDVLGTDAVSCKLTDALPTVTRRA